MRILVCGGRHFADPARVYNTLDGLSRFLMISIVIHGAARGADTFAEEWARTREVPYLGCPAKWKEYGRAAGTRRNEFMLTLPIGLVVAFPGGTGTAHMVRISREHGLTVIQG